jgi:4-azaleucine resistance transporter AzlC
MRRGFLAVAPLWPGDIAFGLAFALIARTSGFSGIETQALSMLVFAGSAQLAAVTLFADGAGVAAILLTVLVLNLRHVLYALSLDRLLTRPTRVPRPLLAFFLTDEAYGFAIRRAAERDDRANRTIEPFYVGVAVSLYITFAIATLCGLLFGSLLPNPERLALGFIFPLTFLALLIPLVQSRRGLLVACVAGAVALSLSTVAGSGETIVGATVVAAGLGTALDLRDSQ